MYRRAKINDARSASLESEIDKEARKAILFSLVATVLSLMEKGSTTISVVGVTIDVKDQYILNGTFCALALFYGFAVFSTGMQLYAAGRRNELIGMYRRILCWARNRLLRAHYQPATGKLVARAVAFIMGLINATMGLLIIVVYGIGISLTMGDFFRTANLLWLKAIN